MKFSIYLSAVILLLTSKIFPQWEFINPSPLLDKAFVIYSDSVQCDVLTERGNIASSPDGGSSWNYYYSNLPVGLFNAFFNDEIGWAVGGGKAFKTTDRGRSWIDEGAALQYTTNDIYFSNSLNGWAVGNSYIKSTSDGGDTWTTQNLCGELQFIYQYNDTILFTGSYDSLYRSTDTGNSWHTLPKIAEWAFEKFTVLHTDSITFGYLLYDSKIDLTTDGGNSWSTVFPNYDYAGISELKAHGSLLLGISNRRIFRSTDYGLSWDTVYIPVGNYSKVSFGTDNIIYLSAPEGKLIKSTDGGLTFSDMIDTKVNGNIDFISAADSECVYITTSIPIQVYKTINGGENFTEITPQGFSSSGNKTSAVTRDMAVAFAGTTIYTTKNGGQNWNASSYGPPNTYSPMDVYFRDTLNGMVSCGWGLMRETTNGGDTWTNRFIVTDTTQMHLLSLSFPDPQNGYFCTGDKLYNTTNGGTDWDYHSYLNPQFGRVKFTDAMNGIGWTYQNLYYTSDGGINWSLCDSLYPCYDFDIMKNGNGSVLMAIDYAYVYTSTDYGRTFTKQILPAVGFNKLRMIDPATAWIGGYDGKIIRYHNDEIITKTESHEIYISKFSLSQNYPNPFNPNTTIKYSIPVNSYVTIKIYDILGREIVSLVNAGKAAGNYNVDFNAAGLASGVYFYRLEARSAETNGHFTKVNKMILLK